MKRVEFRAPQKHKDMVVDIAKNRGRSIAFIYREALEEYLSGYSTIPSLKMVAQQVDNMLRRFDALERDLLKKGVID